MATRIVIIDDDQHLTNLLSEIMVAEDYEAHVTNNPSKGFDLVCEVQPDLVLLDWMMPDKDGMELLAELKRDVQTKDIPVFMLTAKGMLSEVNQLFSAGADDYISKPFNPTVIAKQISRKLKKCQGRRG